MRMQLATPANLAKPKTLKHKTKKEDVLLALDDSETFFSQNDPTFHSVLLVGPQWTNLAGELSGQLTLSLLTLSTGLDATNPLATSSHRTVHGNNTITQDRTHD